MLSVVVSSACAARRGRLREALELRDVPVLFEGASADEIALLARLQTPDAAVLAFEPGLFVAPVDLVQLRDEHPQLAIVVVSAAAGQRPVSKALRAGARGYVLEDELERTLVPTLLAVAAGQVAVPGGLRHQVVRPAVSFREKQVLELAARGYTNGQIAQELYLAESTVKSHLSTCFRKLGVRSRAEAAALVLDPQVRLELGLGASTVGGVLAAV